MIEVYLIAVIALIPLFKWRAENGGREFVQITATAGILLWVLAVGGIPFDGLSWYVYALGAWWVFCMIRTQSKRAWMSMVSLLCGLVLFEISRETGPVLIWLIVLVGLGHALFLPWEIFLRVKNKYPLNAGHIKGYLNNSNHTANYLIMPLFCCVYLGPSYPILYIAAAGIAAAVVLLACRAAIVAVTVGLLWILYPSFVLVPVAAVLFLILHVARAKRSGVKWNDFRAGYSRFQLWSSALQMIARAPFFGHGFESYVTLHPQSLAMVRDKYPGLDVVKSHRVHNDFLEFWVETGFVGLILFIMVLSGIPKSGVLFGGVIAFLVHSAFFFPFREVHTSAMFWPVAGILSGSHADVILLSVPAAVVVACFVLGILPLVLYKFLGAFFWDRVLKAKDTGVRQENAIAAVRYDPYNVKYLCDGYHLFIKDFPGLAWAWTNRAVSHFDGGKVRWGLLDLHARAALRYGNISIAEESLNEALRLDPGFEPSRMLLPKVQELRVREEKAKKDLERNRGKQKKKGKK